MGLRRPTQMPEIWSLFTRLIQQLGVRPSMKNKAVCMMVMLLSRLTRLRA